MKPTLYNLIFLKHLKKSCLALAFYCWAAVQSVAQCPSDHAQLRDWYLNNNGATWDVDWNTPPQSINDVNMTNWDGITTNASGCVTEINLSSSNISGILPNFNLPNLQNLNLQINDISGILPSLNLSNLETINLMDNDLISLSNLNLPNLQSLNIRGNQLSGNIPSFILPSLITLELGRNQLSGNIPNFNLPNLQNLSLDINQLSGNIPNFNLPNLQKLTFKGNQLSGSIPNFNLPNLTILELGFNQLSGSIPNFNLTNLKEIWLYNNQLSGSIPNFNLQNLKLIQLSSNQLSGNIPNFNLPNLQVLAVFNNQLSGNIPNFNLPNLHTLWIYNNQLSGNIPNFNLPNLERLSLNNNQLSGCIPEGIKINCPLITASTSGWPSGDISNNPNLATQSWADYWNNGTGSCVPCATMTASITGKTSICGGGTTTLSASSNAVLPTYLWSNGATTADISVSAGSYSLTVTQGDGCTKTASVVVSNNNSCRCQDSLQLVAFYNSNNGATWTNPWNLNLPMTNWSGVTLHTTGANVGCVRELYLNNRNITGSIPNFNLPNLESFDLEENQLSGTIPNFNLSNLKYLSLSKNSLSGIVPNFNLPNLEILYLRHNQLSGTIPNFNLPNLKYLALSDNQLSGTIPNFNLPNLQRLYISYNQLNGTVPNFNLPNLETLFLANNQISGTTPNFNLPNLQGLFLQNNQLSGTIPNFNLPNLQEFYLDNNQLSGIIPNFNLPKLLYLYLNNNQLSGCIPQGIKINCPLITATWGDISNNPNLATQSWADYWNNGTGACVACASMTANITGNLSPCGSTSTTLTATSNAPVPTYLWSSGATTASISANSGVQNVTITQSDGCIKNYTVTLTPTNLTLSGNPTAPSCLGGSDGMISLSASTSITGYTWNSGGSNTTGSGTNINSLSSGTYQITATLSNGCEAIATNVIVPAGVAYSLSATPTVSICVGKSNGSIALNAAASINSYIWNNGGSNTNGTGASISNLAAGTYSITATLSNNCIATASSVSITNFTAPTVTITPTKSSICVGQNTSDLNTSGTAGAYVWSNNDTTPNITANSAGTYSVTLTDANTCTATSSVTITASPSATASITAPTGICTGTNTVLSGNNNQSYLWNNGATTPDITVNTGGNYSLTVTNAQGCTATDSKNLSTFALPNAVINGNTSICSGKTTTLTASGGSNYKWNTNESTSSISVNIAGTYIVTVTSADGCAASTSTTISNFSSPTISINSSITAICEDQQNIALNTTGSSGAFVWSNNETNSSISITKAGTYSVTLTDGNSCTATDSKNITALPKPTIGFNAPTGFCQGSNATIALTPNAAAYNWGNGETTQQINVSNGGKYFVTVTNAQGCTSSADVSITEYPNPNPSFTGATFICPTQNATIGATGDPSFDYKWSSNTNVFIGQNITISTTGNYTLTVTSPITQCKAIKDISIGVGAVPTATLTVSKPNLCDGLSSDIEATNTSNAQSFLWNTNETNSKITVTKPDTYILTITGTNGCTAVFPKTIGTLSPANFSISGSNTICNGQTTTLKADPQVANSLVAFKWSTGSMTDTIKTKTPNTYKVTVTDLNGCISTNSVSVTINSFLNVSIQNNNVPIPNNKLLLCEGQTATIAAVGGDTFLWNNGTTSNFLNINQSGTYAVTATSTAGCVGQTAIDVTVNPIPALAISGDTTLCGNQTGNLTASGIGTFAWNTTSTSPTISFNQPGTYVVTLTNLGCSKSDMRKVKQFNLPTALITGDSTLCNGSPANLNGLGGTNFVWSNGSTNQNIQPATAGIFSLTITDNNGCKNTKSINVITIANLSPQIVGKTVFCEGDSTLLTVNGNSEWTYHWNDNSTNNSISTKKSGKYSLTVKNTKGCEGIASVDVTVNPIPTLTLSGDTILCGNQTGTIIAAGTGTFAWDTGNMTPAIDVSVGGNYSVTLTDKGCSMADTIEVKQYSLPTVVIQGDNTVCNGAAAALTVSKDFASYKWSNGETTKGINPSTPKSYSITVTDSNGCKNSDTIDVIAVANLSPAIAGKNNICTGETTQLNINNGNSDWKYVWSTGETTQNIVVDKSNTYKVTVTSPKGCVGDTTHQLTVNPIPSVKINAPKSFCDKQNAILKANGTGTFLWNTGSSNAEIQTSDAGTYSVTISDKGCSNKDSVVLIKNALPTVEIQGDSTLCNGSTTTLSVPTGMVYQWNTTATSESIQVSQPGIYSLTVTDKNGCTNSKSINVKTATSLPVSIDGKNVLCKGESLLLKAVGNSSWSYIWNNIQKDSILNVTNAGTYTVVATNSKGCTGTASIDITTHDIPTLTITGKTTICQGESTSLKAESNATNFIWSTGETTPIFSTSAEGTYSVTVTSDKGCSSSKAVSVSLTPLPSPTIGGIPILCSGNPTTLKAEGGIFDKYLWSTGETTKEISVKSIGTYLLTVSTTQGCTGSTSINVTNGTALNVQIEGKTEFCSGTSTLLKAKGGNNYSWSNNSSTDSSIVINKGGTYSVTATSNAGCTDVKDVTVTENPLPQGVFSGDTTICNGDNGVLTINGGTSYLWNNGKTSPSIGFSKAEIFKVTITDGNGCTSVAEQKTDIFNTPKPKITANLSGLCGNQTASLTVTDAINYLWNTGETTKSIQKPIGFYAVTCTDNNTCKDSASINIKSVGEVRQNINSVICNTINYEITVDNKKYTFDKTGTYEIKTKSKTGCDSLIILNLKKLDANSLQLVDSEVLMKENTKDTVFSLFPKNKFSNKVKVEIIKQPDAGTIFFDTLFHYINPIGLKNSTTFTYVVTYEACKNISDMAEVALNIEGSPDSVDCITVLGDKIYNGLTPNGDGKNEYFDPLRDLIENNCPIDPNLAELRIFSATSDMIFFAKPYRKWFATRNGLPFPEGQPLASGTYYFQLSIQRPKNIVRHVKGMMLVTSKE